MPAIISPDAFKAALPDPAKPYADAILQACSSAPFSPFVLAAIGTRETGWGSVRAYQGLTGDHGTRWIAEHLLELGGAYAFARGAGLLTGHAKPGLNGDLLEVRPPMIAPATVAGWGYGLVQIDAASNWTWLHGVNWAESAIQLAKGLEILKGKRDYIAAHSAELSPMDLLTATVAAYNTGEGNVARELARHVAVDTTTTGGDYSADVLAHARQYASAYAAQLSASFDLDALVLDA